jgi:predicted alpha/beta hydrolase family esterase
MIEFGGEQLTRLPFPSLVVGSLNDPYMTVTELERHVLAWESDLTTIGFAGHINVASGFGRWTEGYGLFERLVRAANRSPWRVELSPSSAVKPRYGLAPGQGAPST